jgi:hypothetical protein
MREALGQAGCAVCRLSLRSVGKLLQSIAYEQVNDLQLRQQLRGNAGFCNAHAHQWLHHARSVLGTALIYRDVLQTALRDLEAAPADGRRGLRGWLGRGRGGTGCPACRAQHEAEVRYLDALLALLAADDHTRQALEASDGVCRRHALAAVRSGRRGAKYIVRRTRAVVQTMLDELDEVIRKEDYRFRDEPRTDAERSVPRRAIAWAAGLDGLPEG